MNQKEEYKRAALKGAISNDVHLAIKLAEAIGMANQYNLYRGLGKFDYSFVYSLLMRKYSVDTWTEKMKAAFCKVLSKYWKHQLEMFPEESAEIVSKYHRKRVLEKLSEEVLDNSEMRV